MKVNSTEAKYLIKWAIRQDGRELRLTGCTAGSRSAGIKYDIIRNTPEVQLTVL